MTKGELKSLIIQVVKKNDQSQSPLNDY